MPKLLLALISSSFIILAPARMVDTIALDTSADLGNNGGGGDLTAAYTVTGTHPILFVAITGAVGDDNISGVTYNGVAMTRTWHQAYSAFNRDQFLYCLAGPATGTHDVVVSTVGGGGFALAGAISYTGVDQTCTLDSVTLGDTSTGTLTISTTTVADNAWAMISLYSGGFAGAGTGTTHRSDDTTFTTWWIGDSNGAITPAGSYSMTVTVNSIAYGAVVSFAPFGGGGGGSPTYPGRIIGPVICCLPPVPAPPALWSRR